DMLQAVPGHAAFRDKARDIVDIDPAPDAFRPARHIALEKAHLVEALLDAVDPAPAEHDVDRLPGVHRGAAGCLLEDADPQFVGDIVVFGQPAVEGILIREFPDLCRIDVNGCHACLLWPSV